MVMYANEVETKEKEKLPDIKKKLQYIQTQSWQVEEASHSEGL